MKKVAIDTNIVVSAALSPTGNPAAIMNMVYDGKLQTCYSLEIIAEYSKVLAYPRLNIASHTQTGIVDAIIGAGTLIRPIVSTVPLPHENDRVFYDTAQTGGAVLITGNAKHYPNEPFIMSPVEFLERSQLLTKREEEQHIVVPPTDIGIMK